MRDLALAFLLFLHLTLKRYHIHKSGNYYLPKPHPSRLHYPIHSMELSSLPGCLLVRQPAQPSIKRRSLNKSVLPSNNICICDINERRENIIIPMTASPIPSVQAIETPRRKLSFAFSAKPTYLCKHEETGNSSDKHHRHRGLGCCTFEWNGGAGWSGWDDCAAGAGDTSRRWR